MHGNRKNGVFSAPRPRLGASSRSHLPKSMRLSYVFICRARAHPMSVFCAHLSRHLQTCKIFSPTVRLYIHTVHSILLDSVVSFYLCAFLCFPGAVSSIRAIRIFYFVLDTLAHTCVTYAIAVFNRIWPPKWYSKFWIIVFFLSFASLLLFRSSGCFFYALRKLHNHFGCFFFFIFVDTASNADAVLH